jgi:hypothetical protein
LFEKFDQLNPVDWTPYTVAWIRLQYVFKIFLGISSRLDSLMQAPGLCPEKDFYQFLKHNPVFNIGKMAFQLPPQQLGMWTY